MRNLILLLMMLGILHEIHSQEEYSVNNIPKALLNESNVVKRKELISFEIVNTGEAILKKKYALTILNEKGDDHAGFMEYYDKIHDLKEIEGVLYDASGKQLKKLKNKDILDLSGVDDNSLIDDHRRKYHNFYYKVYPYTVEYTVEIKYKGTLFFPVWLPREDEDFSVQHSSIQLIYPSSYTIRYKSFNYQGDPVTSSEKDKQVMTFQVKELPAMKYEFASPNWHELNTVVFFGPTNFELQDYKGNMQSWEDFGKFIHALKAGRDQLPENVKQDVRKIMATTPDVKERISLLYRYLQKNTRYVSIQLGIGGWQPFEAKFVAAKAYGDCKALTNYMYSLLKEAGINSYYTLIKSGRNASEVIYNFPSQQFNHVILCVPLRQDTVWLECTSPTVQPGYLGDFTCDRYALMVDENGGKLVRTPRYGAKENLEVRRISASLDNEGNIGIKANSYYGAIQQDRIHGLINNLSKEKVKEVLHEQLDFATYDISRFEYKEETGVLPAINESLELTVSKYATVTGKRLFIVPNLMTRSYRRLPSTTERKYDIELKFEYRDIDSVEINLPAGFESESIPEDVVISTKFGKYQSSVRLKDDKLFYYRSIEQYSGRYPPKDYNDLVKYYESVYKADRNKVVLVRKEGLKGF